MITANLFPVLYRPVHVQLNSMTCGPQCSFMGLVVIGKRQLYGRVPGGICTASNRCVCACVCVCVSAVAW
jgi:hypothetical protein